MSATGRIEPAHALVAPRVAAPAGHASFGSSVGPAMLDDYDVSALRFRDGSRYLQLPASHPAVEELTKAEVHAVGAIRDQEWLYLYPIEDWNIVAARQRSATMQSRPLEHGGVCR